MSNANVVDFRDTEKIEGEILVALAHDRSAPARRALVEAVTELPASEDSGTSQRERKLMFDILRRLVHEAEMAVRRTISLRLSEMEDAPRDLVRLLANDKIEIAYPILTKSGALEDEDLVEVIEHRTFEHQLAVAIRNNISESVADSLVDTGDKNVIKCLLQNSTSKISRATMEYLVEQSEREDVFREPLVRRNDLGKDLAQRMFLWVSQSLREVIAKDWDLDERTVERLITEAGQRTWNDGDTAQIRQTKAQQLAETLEEQGLLSPDSMLRILRNGDVALFIAMFSRLTRLEDIFIKRIVFDPGGRALAAACIAAGVDEAGFRQIYGFSRKVRPPSPKGRRTYQEALYYFAKTSAEAANNIVKGWQSHPNPAGMWDLSVPG
ncbi:MAG: DUF2336 domain-containing protein [Alphaproteobacteria bacterium]|nr:DUF2336 domain-containing protein [Alphaproteobacteria bacterium]